MKIEQFIALRYIITKRNFHFISVITILSLIGITVGVAALISVLSIFNGFQALTKTQFIGFDPHIRIISDKGAWLKINDSVLNQIQSLPEIKILTKTIQGRVVGINESELQVFSIVSVPKKDIEFLDGVRRTTIFGKFSLESSEGFPSVVIGNALADRLKVLPGDTIKLASPKIIEQALVSFQRQREIRALVSGIFNSNIKDYDIMYGFSSDLLGKQLLNPKLGYISSIDIKLNDISKLEKIQNQVRVIVNDKSIRVQTWQDLNPDLFNIMKFERFATFSILSIIIILAVFNVLISLSMTVVEKRQDIGILKSMGANNKIIRNIFIWEGFIIGLFSTVIGTIIGLFVSWGQINYKWFSLDSSKFVIDAIPVEIIPQDVVIIAVFSLVLTTLATIYPAYRAVSTKVIEAIRSE
jgi:lipoprotein-releasing system permease protein